MVKHQVGDEVTILPPYDRDPIIIAMQHYARVAEILPTDEVMVTLPAAPGRFGPFEPARIAWGWRNSAGQWWL